MRLARLDAVPPTDRDALLDLWVASWTDAIPSIDFRARRSWFAERVDGHLGAGALLVTARPDDGGPLLGYGLVNPVKRYLDQLAVEPAWKRRGVGSALVEEAKRLCLEGLGLHVNQDNARAVRFYERHGFAIDGDGMNPRSGLPIWTMRWRPANRVSGHSPHARADDRDAASHSTGKLPSP